jgi:hypothetical protein
MKLRPHWRKATWAIVLWCLLIVVWVFAGVNNSKCDQRVNADACKAGTGIGVAIVMFIGFIGFVFFSLIWIMSRPKHRLCPHCGHDVKKGLTVCQSCGFNFAAVGGPVTGALQQSAVLPPGGQWSPDPRGRHQLRWWDGTRWTDQVSTDGVPTTDSVGAG